MPHPVPHDRREFSHLKVNSTVLPGSDAKRIFIGSHFQITIARVKTAIYPRLGEDINCRANLRVEKQAQPRIKKKITLTVDEGGTRSIQMIEFKIECTTKLSAKLALKGIDG